jgi:hypothetical protein
VNSAQGGSIGRERLCSRSSGWRADTSRFPLLRTEEAILQCRARMVNPASLVDLLSCECGSGLRSRIRYFGADREVKPIEIAMAQRQPSSSVDP